MPGVDHIHIVQVCGGCLIRQIDGVLQRQIPHGEGLELGIAGLTATTVLVVHLGQADCHLAAAGAGCGDHSQRTSGLYILIAAQTLIADYPCHIGRISGDGVVTVNAQTQLLQLLLELLGRGLAFVTGDDYAAHIQAKLAECIDQTQHVGIVGDAQITASGVLDDVAGADGDDDLCLVGHGLQHLDLTVGCKAGQHARRMEIVKQLAAKLQIQLAAQSFDPLADFFRLLLDI